MSYIAKTPKPPYYAVIFTSINTPGDHTEHLALSAKLAERAKTFAGYLGIEGSRNTDGTGVTAVYWKDEASILAWAKDPEHQVAKAKGREIWYSHYMIRICRVEREYGRAD
jgi:heme-degrading monooxygenase HmoA